MEVAFRRSGERRYGILVRREAFPDVGMNPAPGYDVKLPHDVIHFVVESELGLSLGVFGQLAQGGHAGTFRQLEPVSGDVRAARRERRRAKKKDMRLSDEGHEDAMCSERAAVICEFEWLRRSPERDRRQEARDVVPYVVKVREQMSQDEQKALSGEALDRICERLERLSEEWGHLDIGDELIVTWQS